MDKREFVFLIVLLSVVLLMVIFFVVLPEEVMLFVFGRNVMRLMFFFVALFAFVVATSLYVELAKRKFFYLFLRGSCGLGWGWQFDVRKKFNGTNFLSWKEVTVSGNRAWGLTGAS